MGRLVGLRLAPPVAGLGARESVGVPGTAAAAAGAGVT
jgi:hypothetical protein